jgi:hypothetical protein
MTNLSPAAQAVLDAFLNGYICNPECNVAFESDRNGLAAALRAVADQAVPERCFESDDITAIRQQLLAIATDLEAQ